MSYKAYQSWIGLPHRLGADPADGQAADCLVMCTRVRMTAGLATPRIDPQWFAMAAAGQWNVLECEWRRMMCRCDEEPFAMVLHQQPNGLGVCIAVDGGILLVHHRRGVQWLPLDAASKLINLQYWRPQDAAI